MKVKKLVNYAILPTKAHPTDAGWDLYSAGSIYLAPRHRKKVGLGIAIKFDQGTFGKIEAKSSLADKYGIDVLGGVCDENYIGEIFVVLLNTSNNSPVTLPPKSKIAQLVILSNIKTELEEVQELEKTDRGEKGFGSSGLQ